MDIILRDLVKNALRIFFPPKEKFHGGRGSKSIGGGADDDVSYRLPSFLLSFLRLNNRRGRFVVCHVVRRRDSLARSSSRWDVQCSEWLGGQAPWQVCGWLHDPSPLSLSISESRFMKVGVYID